MTEKLLPQTVELIIQVGQNGDNRYAIFSTPEKAQTWMDKHADAFHVSVQMVVDEPDFGDEAVQ